MYDLSSVVYVAILFLRLSIVYYKFCLCSRSFLIYNIFVYDCIKRFITLILFNSMHRLCLLYNKLYLFFFCFFFRIFIFNYIFSLFTSGMSVFKAYCVHSASIGRITFFFLFFFQLFIICLGCRWLGYHVRSQENFFFLVGLSFFFFGPLYLGRNIAL